MSGPDSDPDEPASRTSRPGRRTVLLTAVAVAVVGVATAGVVFAATANRSAPLDDTAPLQPVATPSLPLVRPEPLQTVPPERVLVEPVPEKSLVPEDNLALEWLDSAPMDAATIDWIDSLQTAVQDDPNFGSVAISEDRTTVTITWFGEPSATLREQIDAAPAKVRAVVQPAAFRPAELQELVQEAMRSGLVPGIEVTSGGPENDGSGLQLSIAELPAGRTLQDVGHDLAAALGRSDVPITVEVSGPVIPFAGGG